MKYKAEVLRADVPTVNGRIYTKECLEAANNYIQEHISNNNDLFGELSIKNSDKTIEDELSINFENVSHKITNSYIENDKLYVELENLDNFSTGKFIQYAVEIGMKLYVVSRGLGVIDENRLVSDYELISIDVVNEGSYDDSEPLEKIGGK